MQLPPRTGDSLKKLRILNLELAKKKIKDSINEDNYISHAINTIDEIDKTTNILAKRLREWYYLYLPEFRLQNNDKYVELILKKTKKELLEEINQKDSMGTDLKKHDLDIILNLAKKISSLFDLRKDLESYLDSLLKEYAPNLQELAGTTIASRLIEHTGTLKKLALLPSSTVQILGAEKALFRHLRSGAKPPKYGYIINHPFIVQAKRNEQGKKARALADKLTLCARADYFKGNFIAKKLKQIMEKKFK